VVQYFDKPIDMQDTTEHDARIAKMTFASVYPHYANKVVRKGRSIEELHQVIQWLTGFDEKALQQTISENLNFQQFFESAQLHPNAHMITGMICGYRIENISNPLTQKVRFMDKLVDELARGRKMEKILRTS
jgi:hypothetical protein